MLEAALVLLLVATLCLSALAFYQRNAYAGVVHRSLELERAATTAGKHAESSKSRETAILQAVNDAVVVVNPERQVAFANDAAREVFSASDLIGRRIADVAWGFELGTLVSDALAGRIETIQQTVVREHRSYLVRARPIGTRAELGCVLVFRDVTELQRLGRARRDFVANISHDLRTPLASIKLLVDTLLQGGLDRPDFARELLGKIDLDVDTLRQLSDELLELAQIESGQAPLKLESTFLPDLLGRTVARFTTLAERQKLSLQCESVPPFSVLVDPAKFDKILGNLLHNAIKFTPAGGHVTIKACAADDMVEINVNDTGPGIPSDDLPRIFERFYKVDRSRSRLEKGTGLGLAIAKHLVEAHGGKIGVHSVEGCGATFFFTVPKS